MYTDLVPKLLMSKLEEAIFMDCPKGLERAKHEDALVLKKSVYGLVQAAWQYHKIGFEDGDIDPCIYVCKARKA